jgi:hypothetical protein
MTGDLFSVYDLRNNGLPVAVYATPKECADAMGIKVDSLYTLYCRGKSGNYISKRWEIHLDRKGEGNEKNNP